MKFPEFITDYVKLAWTREHGTCAVVHEQAVFPFLDLLVVDFKDFGTREEAKHYVGVNYCDYLKNKISREKLLNDYWMNQYLERETIIEHLNILTKNALDFFNERNL